MTLSMRDRVEQAKADVTTHSEDPDKWVALGDALVEAGYIDQARNCYKQALKIEPYHSAAKVGLTITGSQEQQGNITEQNQQVVGHIKGKVEKRGSCLNHISQIFFILGMLLALYLLYEPEGGSLYILIDQTKISIGDIDNNGIATKPIEDFKRGLRTVIGPNGSLSSIIILLKVSFSKLFIFQEGLETKIIGKWYNAEKNITVEFFRDGMFTHDAPLIFNRGNYTIIDDDRIRIDEPTILGPRIAVLDIRIEGDSMILVDLRLERVK
jgi:hypothetical protein